MKKISFELKEMMVSLSGTCFWYWNSFYSFLHSCGVSRQLTSRYPKEAYNKYQVMRNILENLEAANQIDVINQIISTFFRLKGAVDKDALDEMRAKNLLAEFRGMVGNDPIEVEIQKRKREESKSNYQFSIDNQKVKKQKLEDLNKRFISLVVGNDFTPQQRGFELEGLFCDLLQMNEIDCTKSYKTADGEQIDGHFRYEKFDYLVECKWEIGVIKQRDLSIFDGKIKGKAQSTRGLFLAANGFDLNAIQKFSGDSPRIILMTGDDLAMILSGQVLFFDAMKAKVDAIVRYGDINFSLRKIT